MTRGEATHKPLVVKENEPLAPLTTWRVGGCAERYVCPETWEQLSDYLARLPSQEPITWLGLGSNVLIADAGLRGSVIHTRHLSQDISGTACVRVEAGVTCAKLARYCVKQGLAGATFFAGIPGSVGGALAMNAGAFGGETWARVVAVEVMDRQGQRQTRTPEAYRIGYRSVQPLHTKEEWFVAAHFQFERGEPETLNRDLRALIQKRNASQPIGVFSCGSVFTNPPGHYAAQLIEACQLKGFRIGDAEVSTKHANFIINLGRATAQDTVALMDHIRDTVQATHQIVLVSEVRLLGMG